MLKNRSIWYSSYSTPGMIQMSAVLTRTSGYVYFRIALHAVKGGTALSMPRLRRGEARGTYLRRQHGHVCFDAEDRDARFSRQSSHSARHLQKTAFRIGDGLSCEDDRSPTRPTDDVPRLNRANHAVACVLGERVLAPRLHLRPFRTPPLEHELIPLLVLVRAASP